MKYISTDKHPHIKEGVIFRESEGRSDMYVSDKNNVTYFTKFDVEVLVEKGYIKKAEDIAIRNPKRFDTYLVKTNKGCYDFAFYDGDWHPGIMTDGDPCKWTDIPQDHYDTIETEKIGPKS